MMDTPTEPLTLVQQQRLAGLSLFYNPEPAPAILYMVCQFAISPCGDRCRGTWQRNMACRSLSAVALNALVKSLRLPEPTTLSLQPDGSHPHPHLALQRGYGCTYCRFRSISPKVILQHLQRAHGGENAAACTSGPVAQRRHDQIRHGLAFQSWAAHNTRRSWLVDQPQSPPGLGQTGGPAAPGSSPSSSSSSPLLMRVPARATNSSLDAASEAFASRVRQEEREFIAADARGAARGDYVAPFSTAAAALETSWMRRTSWEQLFRGTRRNVLMALMQLPRQGMCWLPHQPLRVVSQIHEDEPALEVESPPDDERRISIMLAAHDRIFDRCADTILHTNIAVRRWLRSVHPDRAHKQCGK